MTRTRRGETSSSTHKIVLLPGDGVGPEVVAEGKKVLQAIAEARKEATNVHFEFTEYDFGGIAIDKTGQPLPKKTLDACKGATAILLGAVGGPKWSVNKPRPEEGLLELRKALDLFANIRPCFFPAASLVKQSPIKEEIVKGAEFTVIRELTGGIYFGTRQEEKNGKAFDTMEYTVEEVQRVARIAGNMAMLSTPPAQVSSIDKANVLATSRMWRRVVTETLAAEYPEVKVSHHLVDSAAMMMVMAPKKLNGIVLTENMFGDILTDEASVIPGSLGLLPSASLNGWGSKAVGMYEPIHGSAPDIAGQGIANPTGTILSVAMMLRYSLKMDKEAKAIEQAVAKVIDSGIRTRDIGGTNSTSEFGDAVVAALAEPLNKLNQVDLASRVKTTAEGRLIPSSLPFKRRPMNLCEKIIAHSAIGLPAPFEVKPGDMVCVSVDWTIASELTWKGMEKTFDEMGRPKIWRNDRFWLAIDHTVDPSIYHLPKPRELIEASETFAKEANITDFWGPNQTILHTEFYRERAQPGMMIIGADSHSCSAGGLGTFAVGLGAADVVMPLVTGETWFKVPETCEIRFEGKPPFGIGGKDVILHVLGELKRNTVGFERAVEWTGPGIKHLSCDARFAIANMTTEFGGIAGVFEADEITAAYIAKRKDHKKDAIYFRADEGAEYATSHVIDLGQVTSLVALYPSPDNVVPATKVAGMDLDGCFIGACTTGEEDLILGGLVLEAGLKKGMRPSMKGKRKVTPGSVSIVAKLRRLGLIKVYEQAGFEIGAPGCSYCLGVAADRAGEGEVWLSSQNRNFPNRMGKGSIANLASAATVAASSFEMKVRDPQDLLDAVDQKKYAEMQEMWIAKGAKITISEPAPVVAGAAAEAVASMEVDGAATASYTPVLAGKIQRFGDNVDTDAIIPAEFMPGTSDEDLGTHCFQYFRAEFVPKAKEGYTIVVAGIGFGSGSSREEAPRALKGCGIKAVIAKSYAYIYGRNQPNMALLGVIVKDDHFYQLAQEGVHVEVDLPGRVVRVDGHSFPFDLSRMEEKIVMGGGVTTLYKNDGQSLFRKAIARAQADEDACAKTASGEECATDGDKKALAW
ncbi:hypothetical protein SmJEL517_g00291 [Synchytrium microbalum]|uniref:3-isopropylmalate dehydrogenase n=1 Tax=Synchytrium microbalum TaxID=1806994 RepID=A0A507CAI0_9FUNG|nr:uncharacterized protein SmJEL517_g00291 [Synchytrium microbalum]TPX38057.1 hypothetical protein SmJEL517_g00291 [Synchytrium microbalum]